MNTTKYSNVYRLHKAEVDGHVVQLVPEEESDTSSNYYTLIIGNNGSGKSRLLHSIIDMLRESKKHSTMSIDNRLRPACTIILTTSSVDRYHLDQATIAYRSLKDGNLYAQEDYVYLGSKMRFGTYSSKYRLDRALRICSERSQSLSVAHSFRRIFDFLDYRPIVKISYEIKDILTRAKSNISLYDRLKFDAIELIQNEPKSSRLEELISQIQAGRLNKFSFIYNFSEKHMSEVEKAPLDYNDFSLNLLDFSILRRAKLIKNYKISVFKNSGLEFAFDDASSGEANILTTFLSLIPLLRDKSLILIDEPEISLHPQWQATYMTLLKEVMNDYYGCHVIIASHSHFMASDLTPEDSSIVVMGRDKKGNITSEFYKEETYGWSAENILLNVFNVPAARNYYFAEKVQEVLNILACEQKDMAQYRALMKEINKVEPYLSDSDPLKSIVKMLNEYEVQSH